MTEQRELLERMLAQAEVCVKQLHPRLGAVVSDKDRNLVELERLIFEAVLQLGAIWLGMALSLYASHLAEEAGTRLPCSCGGAMRWVSERAKTVLSLLGKVTYRRVYYHCAVCKRGEAIGDRRWGLEHTRTTPGVTQLVAYLAAGGGFENAAREVCRTLLWPSKWLSGKQVQRLAEPLGQRLGEMEAETVAQWWQMVTAARGVVAQASAVLGEVTDAATPVKRLYVQMDGITVRVRGIAGKGSDMWREVKVGAVFVAERGRHLSQLAKLIPGRDVVDEWVDRPQGLITYVAGRIEAAPFGLKVYAEATRRGLERAAEVVILGDGAHWIWHIAEEHFPGAVQILDFWHASEWVWKVAKAVWGEGSDQAKAWAEAQIAEHLVKGDAEGLVDEIEKLPSVPPPAGESRSTPEKAADYFRNNAGRMRYPEYRALGMQIGTGAVESAAKKVVGQRCKMPGTRWSEEGLAAVLHLRTHVLNDRYDTAIASLPKAA